jgi:hypothetical protein
MATGAQGLGGALELGRAVGLIPQVLERGETPAGFRLLGQNQRPAFLCSQVRRNEAPAPGAGGLGIFAGVVRQAVGRIDGAGRRLDLGQLGQDRSFDGFGA